MCHGWSCDNRHVRDASVEKLFNSWSRGGRRGGAWMFHAFSSYVTACFTQRPQRPRAHTWEGKTCKPAGWPDLKVSVWTRTRLNTEHAAALNAGQRCSRSLLHAQSLWTAMKVWIRKQSQTNRSLSSALVADMWGINVWTAVPDVSLMFVLNLLKKKKFRFTHKASKNLSLFAFKKFQHLKKWKAKTRQQLKQALCFVVRRIWQLRRWDEEDTQAQLSSLD